MKEEKLRSGGQYSVSVYIYGEYLYERKRIKEGTILQLFEGTSRLLKVLSLQFTVSLLELRPVHFHKRKAYVVHSLRGLRSLGPAVWSCVYAAQWEGKS